MDLFQGIAKVAADNGPLVGIVAGLMWLLWKERQEHQTAIEKTVPTLVYEDLCDQRDRDSALLADLSKSVAILVDRRLDQR